MRPLTPEQRLLVSTEELTIAAEDSGSHFHFQRRDKGFFALTNLNQTLQVDV